MTDAAAKTTATHSARYAVTSTVSVRGGARTVIRTSGAMDLTTGSASTEVDLDLAGHQVALHELVVGGTVYIDAKSFAGLPGGLAGLPAGVRWLKVSGFASSSSQTAGNGASQLQLLRQVSPDVKKVGTATIRGTATTAYSAEVDPRRSTVKGKVGPTLQKLIDAGLKALGTRPVPLHVYIDSSGRLRRLTMTMELDVANLGPSTQQMTIDYYDFGAPVHVTAPPASETFDVTSEVGSALSGL